MALHAASLCPVLTSLHPMLCHYLSTKSAGKTAGIGVLKLINEPTAASLSDMACANPVP